MKKFLDLFEARKDKHDLEWFVVKEDEVFKAMSPIQSGSIVFRSFDSEPPIIGKVSNRTVAHTLSLIFEELDLPKLFNECLLETKNHWRHTPLFIKIS